MRRLPPLNALRAFEAVGRHLSVSRAAAELNVTPAAVSHQVKGLETALGVSLLRRLNRAVVLTEAGQLCLPLLSEGFDRLNEAVAKLETGGDAGVLTVSVTPGFASKWLVPRLERFTEANPAIDVHINATMEVSDLKRGGADIAVRFGTGNYPDLVSDKLFDESAVVVCSPSLVDGRVPLREPADLAGHVLLHDHSHPEDVTTLDWAQWLRAAGVSGVDISRGLRFNAAGLAIQAAAEGAGVLLARHSLVADDLASGRLVVPFSVSLPIAMAYHLVCDERSLRIPKVKAFRDWVLREAALSARKDA